MLNAMVISTCEGSGLLWHQGRIQHCALSLNYMYRQIISRSIVGWKGHHMREVGKNIYGKTGRYTWLFLFCANNLLFLQRNFPLALAKCYFCDFVCWFCYYSITMINSLWALWLSKHYKQRTTSEHACSKDMPGSIQNITATQAG